MRHHFARAVGLALIISSGACSSKSSSGTPARADRNVITREQLDDHRFTNIYEAVAALRSNWLQTRGTDSFRQPTRVLVYLDDTRLGGVETLRGIGATGIIYVRYFDGVTASGRWGLDHGQGVIFVSTRPREPSGLTRSSP